MKGEKKGSRWAILYSNLFLIHIVQQTGWKDRTKD